MCGLLLSTIYVLCVGVKESVCANAGGLPSTEATDYLSRLRLTQKQPFQVLEIPKIPKQENVQSQILQIQALLYTNYSHKNDLCVAHDASKSGSTVHQLLSQK